MRYWLSLFLLILVASTSGQSAAQCIQVDKPVILTRHLAQVDPVWHEAPGDVRIGYTPAPGNRRLLPLRLLRRLANSLKLSQLPTRSICVERKTRPLQADELLAAMQRTLQDKGLKAEIELIEYSRSLVPTGELIFPFESLRRPPQNAPDAAVLWKGYVRYDRTRRFPIWARVRLSAEYQQVFAAEDLLAGVPVRRSQLKVRTVKGFPIADPRIVRDPRQVAGLIPYRKIRAGTLLKRHWFRRPRAVRRGDIVHVVVQVGGARLKLEARADSSAQVGQLVRLINPMSGRKFVARVVGEGQAVVSIPGNNSAAASLQGGEQ